MKKGRQDRIAETLTPYLVCLRVTPAASKTCANVAGLLPRMAAGLYIFSLLNMSEAESRSLPSSSSLAIRKQA